MRKPPKEAPGPESRLRSGGRLAGRETTQATTTPAISAMPNWRVPIAQAAAAEPSSRSRSLRDSKPRLYSQRAISSQPVNWMSDMKVNESINTSGLARNPRVRTAAGHAGSDPRRSKRVQGGEARGQQHQRRGPQQAERIAEHLGQAGSEIDLHGQVRRGPRIEPVLAGAQQVLDRARVRPAVVLRHELPDRIDDGDGAEQRGDDQERGPPARPLRTGRRNSGGVHRRK